MARIKLTLPDKFIFSTQIKVRITDINYGNHLGNDSLLAIIQESRLQFLQSIDYSEVDIEGVGIIMGDVVIEYKRQAYYGDDLKIDIDTGDIARKSFDIYYRVSNQEDKLVALCKTGIVFYDYKQKKAVMVPKNFIKKINLLHSET
jgi:acyl-CoA thioester hydrolase